MVMKEFIKDNSKEFLKILILVIVLSFISVIASNWLRSEIIQEKVDKLGIWGPLIVILYTIISHIVAPLAGTPGIIVTLSAFGLFKGWLYLYVASLISATINFYIARKWGRDWVIKLAGRDSINRIDQFVEIMGIRLLVIARLFGFPLYEFISYAVGFTTIPFRTYIIITALIMPIPGILFSILLYQSLTSPFILIAVMFTTIIVGILFSWYTANIYLKVNKKRN